MQDKKAIAENIRHQAQYARALFIWTDCDREGEHIGGEIREEARKGKPGIEVKRARFSNIERAYVWTIEWKHLVGSLKADLLTIPAKTQAHIASCQKPRQPG